MRLFLFFAFTLCLPSISCTKPADKPTSKTDYLPINSALTPLTVASGQAIKSRVNVGFHSYNAEVTFLNFEVTETAAKQFDIRAMAFYKNINYEFSLPVDMTFDTILVIRPTATGQHILRFFNASHLIQTDTIQVN